MPPKFDMQKAREMCDELLHPGEDCGASCQFCDEAKTALPAALDEIARLNASLDDAEKLIQKNAETINAQAKRIAELQELDECLNCGRHLFSSDPVLGKDSIYRLGAIFFDPGSPGGREEPPEPACAIPICQDCLEDLEKVDLIKEKIAKQRAALKILGKRSAKRGKALVAERAKAIRTSNNCPEGGCISTVEEIYDYDMDEARQRLHQEGLI